MRDDDNTSTALLPCFTPPEGIEHAHCALDHDGCAAKRRDDGEYVTDPILLAQLELLKQVSDHRHFTMELSCFSLRQGPQINHVNHRRGGSFIPYHLNIARKINAPYDLALTVDCYRDEPYGHAFRMMAYMPRYDETFEPGVRRNHLIFTEIFDESKLSFVFAKAHRLAILNPDKQCILFVADDLKKILKANHIFYQRHPEFLPANVTVRFILSKSSDDTPPAQYETDIQGTGKVCHQYPALLRRVYEVLGKKREASSNWEVMAFTPILRGKFLQILGHEKYYSDCEHGDKYEADAASAALTGTQEYHRGNDFYLPGCGDSLEAVLRQPAECADQPRPQLPLCQALYVEAMRLAMNPLPEAPPEQSHKFFVALARRVLQIQQLRVTQLERDQRLEEAQMFMSQIQEQVQAIIAEEAEADGVDGPDDADATIAGSTGLATNPHRLQGSNTAAAAASIADSCGAEEPKTVVRSNL